MAAPVVVLVLSSGCGGGGAGSVNAPFPSQALSGTASFTFVVPPTPAASVRQHWKWQRKPFFNSSGAQSAAIIISGTSTYVLVNLRVGGSARLPRLVDNCRYGQLLLLRRRSNGEWALANRERINRFIVVSQVGASTTGGSLAAPLTTLNLLSNETPITLGPDGAFWFLLVPRPNQTSPASVLPAKSAFLRSHLPHRIPLSRNRLPHWLPGQTGTCGTQEAPVSVKSFSRDASAGQVPRGCQLPSERSFLFSD